MSYLLTACVWFARLPGELNHPSCKAILARIADVADHDGRATRPLAKKWIAEDVGLSTSQVRRWLIKLSDARLTSTQSGCGRGNLSSHSIVVETLLPLVPSSLVPNGLVEILNAARSKSSHHEKKVASKEEKGGAHAQKRQHGCATTTDSTISTKARLRIAPEGACDALALAAKEEILKTVRGAEGFLISWWPRVRHVERTVLDGGAEGYLLYVDGSFAVERIEQRLPHQRFRVLEKSKRRSNA